ncbi:MAG: DUF3786 domain-containing protein [Desulfobacterales bacterium]|nr:DUF3786 domain-containing protein [Desulfobacterales bacterium]
MSEDNYGKIVRNNLEQLYNKLPSSFESKLPCNRKENGNFIFTAFGEECEISPEGISLDGSFQWGALGIIISLYCLNACSEEALIEPLKAYKDLPNSAPYAGAFVSHTEKILVPYVEKIKNSKEKILKKFEGKSYSMGDFSFLVKPLPKISLCYIFYLPDDEFPASATCLFSNNVLSFLPIDGIADTGEYTSKKIVSLL